MRAFTCLVWALLAASCYGGSITEPPVEGVTYDPSKNRLEPGIYCVKDALDSDTMLVDMTVFQADDSFQYVSPHPLAGQDIFLEECVFLNTSAYMNDNTQMHTDPSCDFSRVNTGSTQNYNIASTVMHESQQNVSLTSLTDSGDLPCGGYTTDDNSYTFVVQCSRNKNFHHFGDVTFTFCCDNATSLERRQQGTVTVADGKIFTIDDQYSVDFGVYEGITGDPSERIAITGPVYLGQPIIFEACLSIADSGRPYFEENMPIGMYLFNCKATVIDYIDNVQFNHQYEANLTDEFGCATGEAPWGVYPAGVPAFGWYTTDNDFNTTLDWRISPNCFRTVRTISATSFQAFNKGSTIPTRYECDVEYCLTVDDTRCFPFREVGACETDENVLQCSTMCPLNDTLPDNNAPLLPMTKDLPLVLNDPPTINFPDIKRRQVDTGPELPEAQFSKTLTVELTVINSIAPNDDNIISGQEERQVDGCFETDAFIGLSVVIAVLVVLAMAVAMCFGMRLNQIPSDKFVSGIQDSNSGFQNKGYYS